MPKLVWDEVGKRFYETGVDRGVLYIPDAAGAYVNGVAWNGLITVTESPSGGEPTPMYADNIKYLNLQSVEEFMATLEAFTYPDEFAQFDGLGSPSPGVLVSQQSRKGFGLSYRSRLGDDLKSDDRGYKLHLVYGCKANPSEKAYTTINDTPEAINFSWDITTTPVEVPNFKPSSLLTIDSTKVSATALANLERTLYGDAGINPALPLPASVISMFTGTVIYVTATAPTYNATTDQISIPSITGITYYINGAPVTGLVTITGNTLVTARPNPGYLLTPGTDDDWYIIYS